MLAAARRVLAERAFNRVRLVQASAAAMPLPADCFDLVHERLALVSLAEAPEAIAEMVRVTRPGGWVTLQEYDHVSLLCQPPRPAWDVLMNAWHRVRAEAGMDITVGRHLPGLLRAAGLADITVEVDSSVRRSGAGGHVLPLYMAALHRDRMTTVGGLTAAELDGAVADLTAHLDDPNTIMINPMLFKRGPASPAPRVLDADCCHLAANRRSLHPERDGVCDPPRWVALLVYGMQVGGLRRDADVLHPAHDPASGGDRCRRAAHRDDLATHQGRQQSRFDLPAGLTAVPARPAGRPTGQRSGPGQDRRVGVRRHPAGLRRYSPPPCGSRSPAVR